MIRVEDLFWSITSHITQCCPHLTTCSHCGNGIVICVPLDRILKILSSSHQSQEVMILYKNENFCHESSNLSCFDDEIQQTSRNTYVIQPDDYREDTVRIIYFRNEQRAEVVLLKKENVIARFWAWCKGKIDCLKPEDPD
ncbi:unnamed protein product [Acanthoscelides obtectus]|uniref:Uncharacterized protein n=1 Tax=Acanthoscelides obtectus TaxID=200917 RepID=A0A9P0JHV0_ACAOB|nr:unnamed protein product [Acanthoscelides obtectus]CAK1661589.1 hypothetical protein AOBTE_LOCUS22703 [Acanthoscelides obtectus]